MAKVTQKMLVYIKNIHLSKTLTQISTVNNNKYQMKNIPNYILTSHYVLS